jgi:hypothetical protein
VNPREIKYFALKGAKSVFAGPLPDGVTTADATEKMESGYGMMGVRQF